MSTVSILTATLLVAGSFVTAPIPLGLGTCETTPVLETAPAEVKPMPYDEDPPWVDCLDRDHPQICAFCCWDWSDECQAECDEADAACWRRCINEENDCVDACYGL